MGHLFSGYIGVTTGAQLRPFLSGNLLMKKLVSCPVETTLEILGGRWKVLIIHNLLEGTRRFGELTRLLSGISARTLSKQLRELETDGIIQRQDFDETIPRVEYSLTQLGQALHPVLLEMETWGKMVDKMRSEKE